MVCRQLEIFVNQSTVILSNLMEAYILILLTICGIKRPGVMKMSLRPTWRDTWANYHQDSSVSLFPQLRKHKLIVYICTGKGGLDQLNWTFYCTSFQVRHRWWGLGLWQQACFIEAKHHFWHISLGKSLECTISKMSCTEQALGMEHIEPLMYEGLDVVNFELLGDMSVGREDLSLYTGGVLVTRQCVIVGWPLFIKWKSSPFWDPVMWLEDDHLQVIFTDMDIDNVEAWNGGKPAT